MDEMIRIDMPEKRSAAPLWVGGIVALLILIGSISLIWVARDSMNDDGRILLAGIAIISLLALMTFFVMSRTYRVTERRHVRQDTVYSGAFYSNVVPSLVISDGNPVVANKSYFALAEELGAESLDETPPVIDRLFTSAGNEAAAAIFRLHHIAKGMDAAEETIDLITPQAELKRYKIKVNRMDNKGMLWQIIEKDGRVLAANDVLLRWLGGTDNARPEALSSFIENPEALLDSPAEAGRTVRTDTRLITRKGVVTPTVMVANWHTLNSGDVVASAALYGHSTLARPADSNPIGMTSEFEIGSYSSAPVAVLKLESWGRRLALSLKIARLSIASWSAMYPIPLQIFPLMPR